MNPEANVDVNGFARHDLELPDGLWEGRPPTYGFNPDELVKLDAAVKKPIEDWTEEESRLIIRAAMIDHPGAAEAIYGPPLTEEERANAAATGHYDVPLNRLMSSREWNRPGIFPDQGPCLWPVTKQIAYVLHDIPEKPPVFGGIGHTSASGGTGGNREGGQAAGKSQGS